MEAPNKIYLSPKSFEIGEKFNGILTTMAEGDIEYTRTDSFIEKAVKWIRENWREHVWLTDNDIIHFGLWENDFCRAMKGE